MAIQLRPVPSIEKDLADARETIRNIVHAFREGDKDTQKSVLEQAAKRQRQLALNAGRRRGRP